MSSTARNLSAVILVGLLVGSSFCPAAEQPAPLLAFGTDDTIVAVRVKSINTVLNSVGAVMTKMEPQAGGMMKGMIQMALAQLQGADLDGPAAILVLDPKKYEGEPMVGVVTLAAAGDFNGPQGSQALAIGKLGLVADNNAVLEKVSQMIQDTKIKAIPTRDMGDQVVIQSDVGGLLKRYELDIKTGLQQARAELRGAGADAAAEELKQMGLRALDHAAVLIQETQKQAGLAELGLTFGKDRIKANLAMEAVAGSGAAQFLSKNNIAARKALTKLLPKNAIATSVSSYDPDSFFGVVLGVVGGACDIAGLAEPAKALIHQKLKGLYGEMTGANAQAMVPTDKGFATVAVHATKGPEAARARVKEALELAQHGALADLCQKYGLTIKLTPAHRKYKNIPIDKVEAKIDAEKLAAALPLPAEARRGFPEALKKGLQNRDAFVTELVYPKRALVTADVSAGPEPMNAMIDLIKTEGADGIGSSPEYRAALDKHPQRSLALWHVSLFGYLDAMSKTVQQAGDDAADVNILPTREELPAEEEPITGAVRIEGNRLIISADVPVQPIAAFAQVMKKKTEEKMRKQMEMMEEAPVPAPVDPAPVE
ncbi:MAG: hypothetical protein ACOC8E_04760 [Planctomycetota bacterium]